VVLDGYTEALSGSFTFDTTDDEESGVSIDLTGLAPFSGTYTQGTAVTVGVENNINAQGPAGGILFLNFSDALNTGPGTVDELSSAYLSAPLDVDCFALCSATSLVGGAGDPPPSGVPEPTSLAPLGSALAILALLRWRRRSGAVSQPARTRQA
jgi:hypothetical protein